MSSLIILNTKHGRSQYLVVGRGGENVFFFLLEGEGGSRACSPERICKTMQFGAFRCIFGSDFVFKNIRNYHFLYKNKYFRYTLAS